MCMCVLSFYTLYMSGMLRQGMGGGGVGGVRREDSLRLEKKHTKNRLKSLFSKNNHIISASVSSTSI